MSQSFKLKNGKEIPKILYLLNEHGDIFSIQIISVKYNEEYTILKTCLNTEFKHSYLPCIALIQLSQQYSEINIRDDADINVYFDNNRLSYRYDRKYFIYTSYKAALDQASLYIKEDINTQEQHLLTLKNKLNNIELLKNDK